MQSIHFTYIKTLQFDDFAHWTAEDFAYYNKISYEVDPKHLLRDALY